jgi:hypothetical protein
MASYARNKTPLDPMQLEAELLGAELPVEYVNPGALGSGAFTVFTTRDLDATEVATMDEVIEAHDGRPRRPRLLVDIYQDVSALSGEQKTNIGTDLFGGSPSKLSQDSGPNAPDLLVLWTLRQLVTLSQADKRLLELDAITIYVHDNPRYLDPCLFDLTISIPGDEPVP